MRGETAEHLRRVLRAAAGQTYELSDGGTVRLGKIERVMRDAVEFSLHEAITAGEQRLRLTLGLSIVKFDRFEWAIEKATELGVAEIVPLAAMRSESRLISSAEKRAARWKKILIEAAQQSRRVRAPELRETTRLDEFLRELPIGEDSTTVRVWLSEDPAAPRLRDVLSPLNRGKIVAATLTIGPEGGWTEEENAVASPASFIPASLGPQILRTETAVAAAISAINYALGD